MQFLVNDAQSAFIMGRSIHDNFMFVQEMIRSLHIKKASALLLKLDIHKALDTVSWEFLIEVLTAKGFRQKWRNWISSFLFSASTRILVNDELSDDNLMPGAAARATLCHLLSLYW